MNNINEVYFYNTKYYCGNGRGGHKLRKRQNLHKLYYCKINSNTKLSTTCFEEHYTINKCKFNFDLQNYLFNNINEIINTDEYYIDYYKTHFNIFEFIDNKHVKIRNSFILLNLDLIYEKLLKEYSNEKIIEYLFENQKQNLLHWLKILEKNKFELLYQFKKQLEINEKK